jgi:hypothetical protein
MTGRQLLRQDPSRRLLKVSVIAHPTENASVDEIYIDWISRCIRGTTTADQPAHAWREDR